MAIAWEISITVIVIIVVSILCWAFRGFCLWLFGKKISIILSYKNRSPKDITFRILYDGFDKLLKENPCHIKVFRRRVSAVIIFELDDRDTYLVDSDIMIDPTRKTEYIIKIPDTVPESVLEKAGIIKASNNNNNA